MRQLCINTETHPAAIEVRTGDVELYAGHASGTIEFLDDIEVFSHRFAADVDDDRHVKIAEVGEFL